MKKFISYFMILLLAFSLTSCGKAENNTETSATSSGEISVVDYYRNFCTQAGETITDSANEYLSENSSIFISDDYSSDRYASYAFHFDDYYDDPAGYRSGLAELRDLRVISCNVTTGGNQGILLELTDGNNGYAVFMFGEYEALSEGDTVSLIALPLCACSDEVLVLFAGVSFM